MDGGDDGGGPRSAAKKEEDAASGSGASAPNGGGVERKDTATGRDSDDGPNQTEDQGGVPESLENGAEAGETTRAEAVVGGRAVNGGGSDLDAPVSEHVTQFNDNDVCEDDTADTDDDAHVSDEVDEGDEEADLEEVSPSKRKSRGYNTSPPEVNAAVARGDAEAAVDRVPKFNERRLRLCSIKGCIKLGRGTRCAFMCYNHSKSWEASGAPLPEIDNPQQGRQGRSPKSKPKPTTPSSSTPRRGGAKPSRAARSMSDDACYIDGCDLPKDEGVETCEEHSSLNQGGSGKRMYTKRSDYWSSKKKEEEEEEVIESEAKSEDSDESENEAEQTVSILKGGGGRSKKICRVGGCPKYQQHGRDGMCVAHFNAVKLYGVEAVLAEGIEVGAQTNVEYSARKKHTNKKKSRRSSSESPQKLRAKRTKQDAETTSVNPRRASPKRKKPVETTEQLPPSRLLEKELGLPKYDDNDSSKCIVGACSLGIQIPRQYRMCRSHYRELVDGKSKEKQKKYAEYALLVRPSKSPGFSPSKFSSKKSSKSNASPRKRMMSTDGTEGVSAKTKRLRAMTNMPAVVDDRRAPDATEEAVVLVSAQVYDIWKVLPSEIDLNSPPPISDPVFFGDTCIAAEYSNYDAKPILDENSTLEDEASTKKDDLKALGVEFVDLDPKMNYNIIHLAVKARLAAENYTSALSLCQKALLDWYDLAEKCARFHLDDPPEGAIDSNVASMGAVCDSLAGLWCVYVWLLQELVALNSSRSPSIPDDASMPTETEPSLPPPAPSSSPSSDGKFLPGTVIPEGLFKVSHDHVQWSDVLAALKVATGCHLAGQRAWPWLARARATVRSSEVTTGTTNMSPLPPTAASDTGNQTNASDLVLKSYEDAVAICREGIGRVSSLPSVQSAKSRKFLVSTSIQDVTLPYFGQENTRALCREINHMFDMKCRVEKALTSQNDNAGDASTVMNGAPKNEKAQDTSHQSKTNNNQSDSTLSAFHAVEWVCNGCAEYFTDKDALRSHKKECPEKEATAIDEKASQTAAKEMPLACNVSRAPIFCETEAMDVLDYLVEIFPATKDDMGRRNGGRPAKVHTEGGDESKNSRLLANIPTVEGQVGLRCIHCRDDDGISGAVFPPTIADLPRAMYRMQVSHFERCTCLPEDCRARYEVMRNSVAPDGFGSKRYWNEVAEGLNLQDTANGMMWPTGNTTASAATVEKASVRFDGSI